MCLLVACAGLTSGQDEQRRQALDAAQKERQQLLFAMRSATADEAARCEASGRECLPLVHEKREGLFEPSALCADDEDVYEREQCQASLSVRDGHIVAVTDFFQYENSCLGKRT